MQTTRAMRQTTATPVALEGKRLSLTVYAAVLLVSFVVGQIVVNYAPGFAIGRGLFKFICNMIPVLIAASACRINPSAKYRILLAALVFCLVGDVAINAAGILGIASFAVAHVGFAVAFLVDGGVRGKYFLVSGAMAALGLVVLALNISAVGSLIVPVVIYIVVISLMVGTSLGEPRLVMMGAILFALSSVLLAVRHITGTNAVMAGISLGVYYLAVYLVSAGMLLHGASPDEVGRRHGARLVGRVIVATLLAVVVLVVAMMAVVLVWRTAARDAGIVRTPGESIALARAAEESEPTNDGPFTVQAYYEGTYGGVDPYTLDVTWDDEWFFEDPNVYNHELARAAVALSAATYEESEYYNGTDEHMALDELLEKLGFSWVQTTSYEYRTGIADQLYELMTGGSDVVEYSIAVKPIVSRETGERRTLICVAVRGTRGAEWLSNANLEGEFSLTDDHAGFDAASSDIYDDIRAIMDQDEDAKYSLLFCGHSRGAGVSNVVAATYVATAAYSTIYEDLEDIGYLFEQSANWRVFCYTFASPMSSTNEMTTTQAYRNIFNILNPADIVTRIPLERWGFHHYGVDLILPKPGDEGYEEQLALMSADYESLTHKPCEAGPDDVPVLDAMIEQMGERYPTTQDAFSGMGLLDILRMVVVDYTIPRMRANHHIFTYIAWMDVLTEEQMLAGVAE